MPRLLLLLLVTTALQHAADDYSWQDSHATVLPTGDLQLKQEPYRFVAGDTVRYIDFENGDDNNAGTREAPWKHHPWDRKATGKAAAQSGSCTYVFKGGVTYRGRLFPDDHGTAAEPIRLCRDPSWGEGPAVLAGSRPITGGWKRGADLEQIPERDKVWYIDLDMHPLRVYQVDASGIVLVRDPNWTFTNPAMGEAAANVSHEVTSDNGADFLLGKDLALTIDFLRVAKSTLADIETDITELRAWQFAGPQYDDFAGAPRGESSHAGALSP